jgi:hypothetical protein
MNFKHHLIVVAVITLVVYFAWQQMNGASSTAPNTAESSGNYVINVTHASWGLNCNKISINGSNKVSDPFANKSEDTNLVKEDNLLAKVSAHCNGKTECAIANNPETIGEKFLPECTTKNFDIEYRCFSYDRPRFIVNSSKDVVLRCVDPDAPVAAQVPATAPAGR